MIRTLISLSIVLLTFTTKTEDVIDRIGVKGPLKFNESNFNLASSQKVNDSYYIQEYLPSNETFDSFNQLLTIHLFLVDLNVKEAVKQKTLELIERKKTDAVCNYHISTSLDGKESMVDFLLGESKDNKMTIVEFNVYRYNQIDLGEKRKAILVYAYSKRAYGEKIMPFLKNLKDDRMLHLNQMFSEEMPQIEIKK